MAFGGVISGAHGRFESKRRKRHDYRRIGGSLLFHCGKRCPWCAVVMAAGQETRPTRDHLTPRSRAKAHKDLQPHQAEILLVVCRRCNSDKKSWTIDEWVARLERGRDPRAAHVRAWIETNMALVIAAREILAGPEKIIAPQPGKAEACQPVAGWASIGGAVDSSA